MGTVLGDWETMPILSCAALRPDWLYSFELPMITIILERHDAMSMILRECLESLSPQVLHVLGVTILTTAVVLVLVLMYWACAAIAGNDQS